LDRHSRAGWQPSLNNRVLVLVNDRMPAANGTGGMGASRFVGQYYTGKRAIPAANVFHLKTAVTEDVSRKITGPRLKRRCASFWTRMAARCAGRSSEIKAAAELSTEHGFETFLHVQRGGLCPGTLAPGSQYYYDPAAKNVLLNAVGSTASAVFSFTPQTAGACVQHDEISDPGMVRLITLSDASETSLIRFDLSAGAFPEIRADR
jgi:hypothetical protein